LPDNEVERYFSIHLPYRLGILVAHQNLCAAGGCNVAGVLNATFVGSVLAGRTLLEIMGVRRDPMKGCLRQSSARLHDVDAKHLGGTYIDVLNLSSADRSLFEDFLRMADKGVVHFTFPEKHAVDQTHIALDRIRHFVKLHIYDATGRGESGLRIAE
jgi:hypothetical protein